MILTGKSITSPGDPLQPVETEAVYRSILRPNTEVLNLLNQLKHIRAIDPGKYRKLKTGLPYMVCADFRPRIRKKENFLQVSRFILDIDHLSEFEIDLNLLRKKLREDPLVEMFYCSPSGDGLKVLFKLDKPISDGGYYSLFYKTFCIRFSETYQLGGAVDTKTNDVSRACFLSHDSEAWFNPDAVGVRASDYLPEEGFLELADVQQEIKEHEKKLAEEAKELNLPKPETHELSDSTLNKIKEKLGVRVREKPKKEYFQPEELQSVEEDIIQLLNELGAKLLKSEAISYGRRLRIGADRVWAELNVFYGKKGVTVVKTAKTGSDKELTELLYLLLSDYFSNRA